MTDTEDPGRRLETAGERLREALRAYRTAYAEATRALAREDGSDGEAAPGTSHDLLREDWESCVAAFRETVDRIGTLQKTLTRDG